MVDQRNNTGQEKGQMGSNHKGLIRACGKGSTCACKIVKQLHKVLKVQAMFAGSAITFSDVKINSSHPNKLPFTGTLLLVDEASQKAPHGSEGHRIYVSKKAAMNNLGDMVGMAINYQPGGLDAHATRHKVGVVTRAWIEGNQVKVSGIIWDRDFPEADKELKGRKDLGMSMELADVYVDDENASVWNLTKFRFTGATILKKDAAAYTKTSLAAKAATREEGDNNNMSDKNRDKGKKKVAASHRDTRQSGDMSLAIQAMGGQFSTALQNTFGPLANKSKPATNVHGRR